MARWNPALHPRGPGGRFKPKLSHSVRVSTKSVSYSVGKRVPIVPGKANVFVGGLVRVERVGKNDFDKKIHDKLVNKVASRFGDKDGTSKIATLLKGQKVEGRTISAKRSGSLTNPTFRVGRRQPSSGGPRTQRAPRRRQPSASRSSTTGVPSTITAGIRTSNPRAVAKRKRRPQRRGK